MADIKAYQNIIESQKDRIGRLIEQKKALEKLLRDDGLLDEEGNYISPRKNKVKEANFDQISLLKEQIETQKETISSLKEIIKLKDEKIKSLELL